MSQNFNTGFFYKYIFKKYLIPSIWKREKKYWKPKTISRLMFSRRLISIENVERLEFSFLFFSVYIVLFCYVWDCRVLCFIDLKSRLQRYVWSDFSFGLCCKNKECGVPEQCFLPFLERQAGFSSGQPWEYNPSSSPSVLQRFDSAGLECSNPAHSKEKSRPLSGSWETTSETLE